VPATVPAHALDPRAGAARGVRALVLAAVAVGIAGVAHTFVDGCVDPAGLALSLGVCWPLAVALTGRRRGTAGLLLWTAAAQVVTHQVVELTCGGSAHPAPTSVLLAHGAAVLVTATLLARGDEGLWVAHALRRLVGLPLPVVPALVVPGLRQPRRTDDTRPPAPVVVTPRVLRGPPSALC
jgi:hypothetical protein